MRYLLLVLGCFMVFAAMAPLHSTEAAPLSLKDNSPPMALRSWAKKKFMPMINEGSFGGALSPEAKEESLANYRKIFTYFREDNSFVLACYLFSKEGKLLLQEGLDGTGEKNLEEFATSSMNPPKGKPFYSEEFFDNEDQVFLRFVGAPIYQNQDYLGTCVIKVDLADFDAKDTSR